MQRTRYKGVQQAMKEGSDVEALLEFQCKAVGLPQPVREFKAIPSRRFRWDFAWVEQRLLVETNGSTWIARKGHTSGVGIARDYEKHNLAVLAGWRDLIFTTAIVKSGEAVRMIEEALRDRDNQK